MFQAQERMQESSQKVDLLRLSLERCMAELPLDHPKHAAIKQELKLGTSLSSGTPKEHSSSPSTSLSSALFKPASLTGCHLWHSSCIHHMVKKKELNPFDLWTECTGVMETVSKLVIISTELLSGTYFLCVWTECVKTAFLQVVWRCVWWAAKTCWRMFQAAVVWPISQPPLQASQMESHWR